MIIENTSYPLSKNFVLYEFLRSDKYPDIARDLKPTLTTVLMLKCLALQCLQPIRDKYGPVDILSGFRSGTLNKKIGGSKKSDHLRGNAADISLKNFNLIHIYKWIVLDSNIPYRQVIYYPEKKFIHISNNSLVSTRKHEALVYLSGEYLSYPEYMQRK